MGRATALPRLRVPRRLNDIFSNVRTRVLLTPGDGGDCMSVEVSDGTADYPALHEMTDQPWRQVPPHVVRWMRPVIPHAVEAMGAGIRAHIPEYNRPGDGNYARSIQLAVEYSVEHFVRIIADPGVPWSEVHQVFFDIGYGEAVEGRSLDQMQNAMRFGSRIAWRHLAA